MKKAISIILCTIIILMFAACAASSGYSDSSAPTYTPFAWPKATPFPTAGPLPTSNTFSSSYFDDEEDYDTSLYNSPEEAAIGAEFTVYITESGTKYHQYGCQYLWNSSEAVDLDWAEDHGYEPCEICCP